MKKLVWSEAPTTTRFFQNMPVSLADPYWRNGPVPTFCGDVATIAYRARTMELPVADLDARITSTSGTIDGATLSDGDFAQTIPLAFGDARQAWIELDFRRTQRIQALTLAVERSVMHPLGEPVPTGHLEASEDGRVFRKVVDLPQTAPLQRSALAQTISFVPAEARVYRIVFERPHEPSTKSVDRELVYRVAELVLWPCARVNRVEDKAGFSTRRIAKRDDTPPAGADSIIRRRDVVDLKGMVRPDGSLEWAAPPGRWMVLRLGYALTGKVNDPASRAGTGLQVDKLDRAAVKRYMDTYLGRFEQALGPELMRSKGLQSFLVDSYEAGPQNWTERMLQEF
jgi:hypothetical protein